MNTLKPYIFLGILVLFACGKQKNNYDATGVFEATEIIISAEATGKILELSIEEGDTLNSNQLVGKIDGSNLDIQKAQIESTIDAVAKKQNDAQPQINILNDQIKVQQDQIKTLQVQLSTLEKEKARTERLIKADAAPTKQLDDIVAQISVIQQQIQTAKSQIELVKTQIASQKSLVNIQNRGVMSEQNPLKDKAKQVDDFLKKCQIINPIKGTVLVKYAEKDEVTTVGKAIYKIGDLGNMILRAYITDSQLSAVKLGQTVNIFVGAIGNEKTYTGKITWIADKAEFTPKTIQTKEERANLVYAMKIDVKNDGFLKIGMYGDVRF